MITRDLETVVSRLAENFPVVVLTGARQTGKTTLLQHLFPGYSYVTLDLPSEAALAENDPQRFFDLHPCPVVIDEIQYAPALFRHIKILVDGKRRLKGQFILTGSQKFNLMKEVSDSLAGRCAMVELEGLSQNELKRNALGARSYSEILHFLVRGGMPELWVESQMRSRDFFQGYVSTYLQRDVRQILEVTNLRDFERFMRACALRSSQLLNKSDLARDVGISVKTVDSWLGILATSNQVLLLEPWFGNFSKRLAKSPKLFFADTGMLCFLLGLDEATIKTSPFLGAIWETFVYAEIRKCMPHLAGVPSVWFYRDQTQSEVDFIIESGSQILLMECKLSETVDAKATHSVVQLQSALGDQMKSNYTKISSVVAGRPQSGVSRLSNGVEVIHGLDVFEHLQKSFASQ